MTTTRFTKNEKAAIHTYTEFANGLSRDGDERLIRDICAEFDMTRDELSALLDRFNTNGTI